MKHEPKPFQREDAAWNVEKLRVQRAVFNWHDMGVGKSCIMVLTADQLEAFNILVLCPAIARENWRREIQKWQTRRRPVFVVGIDGPIPPPRFQGVIIVNYERLQDKNVELLADLRGRSYDLACLDEHHYCSNADAQRTNIIYRANAEPPGSTNIVWLAGQMKKVILASGTPMRNSPLDLWPHLFVWFPTACMHGGVRLGRDAFRDQFCVVAQKDLPNGATVDIIQSGRNEVDLRRRLEGLYRRRRREDVVGQLPPLHVFAHVMSTYGLARDQLAAAADAMEVDPLDTDEDIADALDADIGRHAYQPLEFAAMQRASSICELAGELLAVDPVLGGPVRKVLIAAHHRDVMDELYDGCRNMELAPVQIRGGQSATDRQRAIDFFQDNPRVRACIVQLQAGSTAVNLTAATDMLFAELDFTAANNAQVIARGYRMGQTNPLHVRLCLGDTPVERGQALLIARRLSSIEDITPDLINRSLIAALRNEAPVYPEPQLGADDDWLDGPAAPSAQRPAVADAVSDWLT